MCIIRTTDSSGNVKKPFRTKTSKAEKNLHGKGPLVCVCTGTTKSKNHDLRGINEISSLSTQKNERLRLGFGCPRELHLGILPVYPLSYHS